VIARSKMRIVLDRSDATFSSFVGSMIVDYVLYGLCA